MDTQENIFGLMAIAQEHQAAVKAAVEALASERQTLGEQSVAHSKQLRDLTRVANDAVQAMEKAASDAVRAAMAKSINETSAAIGGAFGSATRPFLMQLEGTVKVAIEAEGKLRGSMAWFSWQWACLAAAGIGTVLAATWLVNFAFLEWHLSQISNLAEQRDRLKVEITQLQAQTDEWSKRGGRAKLQTCGDPERLCVRVDKKMSYGESGDYFVLKGY